MTCVAALLAASLSVATLAAPASADPKDVDLQRAIAEATAMRDAVQEDQRGLLDKQKAAYTRAYDRALERYRPGADGSYTRPQVRQAKKAGRAAAARFDGKIKRANREYKLAVTCLDALATPDPRNYPGVTPRCVWWSYLDVPVPPDDPNASDVPPDGKGWQQVLLGKVNALRAEKGVPPLTMCASLTTAAQQYSRQSALGNHTGHDGPDGSHPYSRAIDAGYRSFSVGENLGYGYPTLDRVLQGWVESPGHYRNLMDTDYTHIGLGYFFSSNLRYGSFWTMKLGYGGVCDPPPYTPEVLPPGDPSWAVVNIDVAPIDGYGPGREFLQLIYDRPTNVPSGTRYVLVSPPYTAHDTIFRWWEWGLCHGISSLDPPTPGVGAPPGCTFRTYETTPSDWLFPTYRSWVAMVGTLVPGHEVVWSARYQYAP